MRFAVPLLSLVLSVVGGCHRFTCSNDVLKEVKSPGGKYVARVTEVSCGATVPYVRVINIQLASRKFDVNKSVVFRTKGQPGLFIRWLDDSHLHVGCDACLRDGVLLQTTILLGITVTYDGVPQ